MRHDEEAEKQLIDILKRSNAGSELNDSEVSILFHYVRHADERKYSFVKDYFNNTTKKKRTKKTKEDN